jgi:hypothetical protein
VTTEELIVHLARSAEPVRPLPAPVRRLCQWAVPALAVTGMGVVLIGARADVRTAAHHIPFLAVAAIAVATSLVAAAAALCLSVPGAGASIARSAPLAAAGSWALVLVVLAGSGTSPVDREFTLAQLHIGCIIQIVALALVPGWALVAMLRRAAPLRGRWTGGLAVLAAAALAAGGTQFICPIDAPAHLLIGHLVPVAALALLGVGAGKRALAR